MTAIAARVGASRLLRATAALAAGAVLSLALPPFDILPALFAYALLVALLGAVEQYATRPLADRALVGFAFGFGYHLAGLWWIGAAFLVDAETFGALLPLAVVGLPLLLAPFHALAAALTGLSPRSLPLRVLALAMALSFTEWLRGTIFTGFPWNTAGAQLTGSDWLLQGASLVGLTGLGALAVLVGALPVLLLRPSGRPLAALTVCAVAVTALYGAARLSTPPSRPADPNEATVVRVVQPAVPQRDKWDPARRAAIWQRLLDATAAAGEADVVVWPETALPFLWSDGSLEARDLGDALGQGRLLITGAVAASAGAVNTPAGAPDPTSVTGPADGSSVRRYTNSVFVIDDTGAVVERYDKQRLVPFGEYLPFAALASRIGLTALVQSAGTFVAGSAADPLQLGRLPSAQPLICYEVIFPHVVPDGSVGWIVNVTNDAWFGDTPGPRQHLRHARVRAVERGLPVIRAANTGISAAIDAEGNVLASVPLGTRGYIDVTLPEPRASLYASVGDRPLFALWLTAALAAIIHAQRVRVRRGRRGLTET